MPAAKDMFHCGGPQSFDQSLKEHITPHKIAVAILIQEFCLLKTKGKNSQPITPEFNNLNDTEIVTLEPRHRRDFCMLILKLIQCPDMEYSALVEILESGEYMLISEHLNNFKKELKVLAHKDVGSIMDAILNLGRLIVEPANVVPLINKSSPTGIFLRRVALFFDKLAFSQLVTSCKAFQHYLKQGLGVKDKNCANSPSAQRSLSQLFSSTEVAEEMDLCSSQMDFSGANETPLLNIPKIDERGANTSIYDGDKKAAGTWSRRQAELFIARQAALIQNRESSALPPAQLHQKIRDVLKANPEHVEAHYLSYLNCMRVKELYGAVDSLRNYFDRITVSLTQDEKNKGFRYAALNVAILHAQFGHREAALTGLREAVTLAHEAKDNVCLQHAQAWLYKLVDENKEVLMERSISKCSDLNLNYLTSLGLQSFSQYAGTTGGKPALVFEVIMRSDVLNCQYSMPDMFGTSFAHKAALWALYGKSEMAALSSQLLLHLDNSDVSLNSSTHCSDGTCQAICNLANRLIDLGEYKLAVVVLDHARVMYPNSEYWLIVEQILYFTQALYQGQWQVAHTAVRQLSTLDKWESCVRLAELLLAVGDNHGVLASVVELLDTGTTVCSTLKVRALLLVAKACPSSVSILTNALTIANYHFLDYLTALVAMELANLQLQMGIPIQALKLMDQSLLVVLSHGSLYDQSSAMLLFAKCKVASVATRSSEIKSEVISECIGMLEKVKVNFRKVEAHSKVKETVHLQALLSHEIGCFTERNKYSLEFRQLDEEFPTKSIPVPANFVLE